MRSEIKMMLQCLHKPMKATGSLRALSCMRSPAWRVALLGAAILALLLAGCELFPQNASSFAGKKYALVVGINDYIKSSDGQIKDLNYSVADAESMKEMLELELEPAGWTVSLITAYLNESTYQNATKKKLQEAFQAVPGDAETFLFYYSGHGYQQDAEAYICPSDFDFSPNTWISSDELSGWLTQISARNKIVILDSCYSGGFVHADDSIDSVPGDYRKGNKSSSLSMFFRFGELLTRNWEARTSGSKESSAPLVISAAGWKEYSYELQNKQHGLFTYYLLDAAASINGKMKGDADGDNVLSCLEAYNYASQQIDAPSNWNNGSSDDFLPHISGGLRDFALIDKRGN